MTDHEIVCPQCGKPVHIADDVLTCMHCQYEVIGPVSIERWLEFGKKAVAV